MNSIKNMKIKYIYPNKVVLEDKEGNFYTVTDENDVRILNKKFKEGVILLALNYKNKNNIKYVKTHIGNYTIKKWCYKYYYENISEHIDEAYKLFLPVIYNYPVIKAYLINQYGKDIFKTMTKYSVLFHISEFVVERYCKPNNPNKNKILHMNERRNVA